MIWDDLTFELWNCDCVHAKNQFDQNGRLPQQAETVNVNTQIKTKTVWKEM